jgi:hypothetical protein
MTPQNAYLSVSFLSKYTVQRGKLQLNVVAWAGVAEIKFAPMQSDTLTIKANKSLLTLARFFF